AAVLPSFLEIFSSNVRASSVEIIPCFTNSRIRLRSFSIFISSYNLGYTILGLLSHASNISVLSMTLL
ncbi:hypothetical protein NT04LM_3711, partial [Listeria monocytogenes FSL F2-208]